MGFSSRHDDGMNLLVHVKQTVGIELRVLSYLNPKVIVDNAIPVHINPSRGKLVGI